MKSSAEIINAYIKDEDWRTKENSNTPKSIGALGKYIIGEVGKDYWMREVYDPIDPEISKAHREGWMHIHDLSGVPTLYCCGYSLSEVLKKGVRGYSNIPVSTPAHHFMSALNQIINLTSVFQNEIMGAVAFSNVDTLLAPYIKKDNLTYDEVKQCVQNFIYSINSNSRCGAEPAFSNVTLDLTPDIYMVDRPALIAGEPQDFTYGDCQEAMDMFNKAFCEIMIAGDASGHPFPYPIPTYNITDRFDWDNPNNELLWEMSGKYGIPYFANFINSDMNPEEARSMCCRLRLDMRELSKRYGGLFGSGDSTGSIGVVTINLPRIAYNAKNLTRYDYETDKDVFFKLLTKYMDLAKESLIVKRKYLQENILDNHLIPAFEEYVGTLNNHFNTIGLLGMNEMCVNLLGKDILDEDSKKFCLKVLDFMREKLSDYQEETHQLFNLEASPAESTCVIGDTLVQTTEGNIPIRELVGREDVHVLCYDTKTNEMRIKKAYDIRKTGSNKQVVKVTFDNGQSEIMTPNHQVYTRTYHIEGRGSNRRTWYTYEWIPAGGLEEGMSIVSNYQYPDGCSGYGKDRIRNSGNGKLLHRFIYEELVGEIPDGYVIHHKDLNKSNNDISNLELMTSTEHKSLHARLNNPRPDWVGEDNPFYGKHHTEESKSKISASKGCGDIHIEDIIRLNNENVPYEDIATILGCSRDTIKRRMKKAGIWESHTPNHKVVSVEYLDKLYDVYNMEVEDCEDYFIGGANGILVHNCYRLAMKDKEAYGDGIFAQGPSEAPYYTNSCHIPVKDVTTIKELFDHQDDLQSKFTGGTVVHIMIEGPITGKQAKNIVKTVCNRYKTPYVSLSPLNTICPEHGLLLRSSEICPTCGRETEMYQRITGYVRCVKKGDKVLWNPGKYSEFKDRNQIKV